MSQAPVMSLTDELLAELDLSVRVVWRDDDAAVIAVGALTTELRRLRAENAELGRVVKDVRWRVDDTTDQLQAYSHNGDRLYGLDEWSVPIRNLKIAIGILDTAMESAQ